MSDSGKSYLLGLFIGWWFGILTVAICCVSPDDIRKEAVKAGVAEYVTGDDGEPEFRWITSQGHSE